jgi:carbon-monoxide dehydrogenase medium subunit
MNDFEFHAPGTLTEAAEMLSQHGGDSKLMAGGTALTTLLKQSLVQPDHIISLHKITGIDSITHEGGILRIGGLTTQQEVSKSSVVQQAAPLLANAYSRVATIRIRNVATVGGGIAHADPAMDPPPSLLILGASVKVISSTGEREIALSDLYADYYETTLEPNEIVTELRVPTQPANAKWTYIKYLPRTADDYATVSVAAMGSVEGGKIADVRLALGAVGSTAIRASIVEEALIGKEPSPALLREAVQAVAGIVDPTDDPRGSAGYKRDMSVVFARRALDQVLGVTA